jgi:hypothetical protein
MLFGSRDRERQVMKVVIQDLLNDIRSGKNIDAYFAFLLNGTLAILSLINLISIEVLGAATLTSLSWLTLNALNDRKENEKRLSGFLENIRKEITSEPLALAFFSENYVDNSREFQETMKSAHELYAIGVGQLCMITAYGEQIHRILVHGGTIKFITVKPDGMATEMATKRGSVRSSVVSVEREHRSAQERLLSLAKDPNCIGSLAIKVIDFLPSYTLYGFDTSDPVKGRIYVWINPFREPSAKRPGFVVKRYRDAEWFDFFYGQFEKLWDWEEAITVR